MKFLLILFSILIISCTKNNTQKKDLSPEITTIKLPPKKIFQINTKDSRCVSELKRAKKDVEKGQLVYAIYNNDNKYHLEIKELLLSKGIKYKPLGENCIGLYNCYGYYMDSIIKIKYGKNFMDRIRIKSNLLSNSRWKTKIYNYSEIDKAAEFPNTSDVYTFNDYAQKMFKKPKNWDFGKMKNNEREFVMISIIINSQGKAIIPKDYWFDYNLKKNNLKHLKYLEKEIKHVVENMDSWKPAVMNKHNVSSEEYIDVTFN
jgi:hypothetical protein